MARQLVMARSFLQFDEELKAPFGFGGDLSFEDHITRLVSQGDGELFCVLVDSKV